MKKLITIAALSCLPLVSYASWQIAGNPTTTPGHQANHIVAGTPGFLKANPAYNLDLKKGPLKDSLVAYANHHNWLINWQAKKPVINNDHAQFAGANPESVIKKVIVHFPSLSVSFNKKSRIAVITDAKQKTKTTKS